MRILLALCLLALPAVPGTALAQAAGTDPARAEVLAAIRRLFDGMRAGDSTAVRASFHPQATMATVAEREGAVTVQGSSVDRFVTAVGTPHPQVWDERTWDEEVRVDGPLAIAWTPYAFYLGGKLSHCGVNAFELVRLAEGWKVFRVIDTRRREGCRIPDRVAPR